LAKAGRWSRRHDRLATRGGLPRPALAVCDQQLHADRPDMPAGCGKPAEQRFAPLLLVEMKALRIEPAREGLDTLSGEGEGAEFPPIADLHVLEKAHQAPARRTMIGAVASHSTSPPALRMVLLNVTIPVSGRLREGRASTTSTSSVRSSPGRKGASQRTS